MFSLAEEIFLLSLLEKKDSIRVPSSLGLPFSLAGAFILELILADNVRVEDGRLLPSKNGQLVTEDKTLRFALEKIQLSEKSKKLEHWVYLLGTKGKRILNDLTLSMIDQGTILRDGRFYHFSPGMLGFTQGQGLSKYLLKREVRDTVLYQEQASERILARLVLLDACDMLDHLFTKDEIIAARKRIKALKSSDTFSPRFLDPLNRIAYAVEYAISAAISA